MSTVRQRGAAWRRIDGVLLLDKPIGISSSAALQQARRMYRAQKGGHTGTLDPLASGLLPLCFGEATKFAQMLLDADKSYVATVRLGTSTSTGDADGEVVAQHRVDLSKRALLAALPCFVGCIEQLPPRHAALKYRGRPYYEYARAGVDIPRTPRQVTIHALTLDAWDPPDAVVSVRCGKGTYVRALAEDLGRALGCGAHLAALRRTQSGGFVLAQAMTLEALAALTDAERDARLLPIDSLLGALPRLEIGNADAARFARGQAVECRGLVQGDYRAYTDAGFAGVARVADGVAQPRRLLAARAAETARESLES